MTSQDTSAGAGTRADAGLYLRVVLIVTVMVLSLAVLGLAYLGYQEHRDRGRAAEEQERYGEVLASARAEATALINIDYTKAKESIDAVAAGATGKFAEEYDTATSAVIDQLERNKSAMDGKVLWAGVVAVDADSATVIVATTGTVANVSTDNKPIARYFRLKLDLQKVDGTWKTADLEFVG